MTITPTPKPPPLFDCRAREHAADVAAAEAMPDQAGGAKAEASERIDRELRTFIHALGVGQRLQTADFMRRARELEIDFGPLDPRCLGGLIARLRGEGVLRAVDRAPTGRVGETHSTVRVVYEIVRLPEEATP